MTPRPQDAVDGSAELPPEVHDELRSLYQRLDETIAALSPVCQLSGRCCRFQEYGHTLFLSSVETDLLINAAPPPVRALDDGRFCPWQNDQDRCTAREARPLGCRVYFCDPAYESHAPEISERFIKLIKELVDSHQLPWDYAPLHRQLHQARESGRFEIELVEDGQARRES
jgi:hypothetical protein